MRHSPQGSGLSLGSFLVVLSITTALGCASQPQPPASAPSSGSWAPSSRTVNRASPGRSSNDYAMRSGGWIAGTSSRRAPRFGERLERTRQGAKGLEIVSGQKCLSWLRSYGIAHEPLESRRGVDTPVRVLGPIAGVTYYRVDGKKLVCDCRLVVALYWISNELQALGVRRVRHSGAYAYRTTRTGRLSLHARGLAIDVHEVELERHVLTVEDNYRPGLAERGCRVTPLNWLACRLERLNLFRELLTPDDDRDHRDHLHLAITPL